MTERKWRGFTALGRLADSATLAQAREELEVVRARLVEPYPDANKDWGPERSRRARPGQERVV